MSFSQAIEEGRAATKSPFYRIAFIYSETTKWKVSTVRFSVFNSSIRRLLWCKLVYKGVQVEIWYESTTSVDNSLGLQQGYWDGYSCRWKKINYFFVWDEWLGTMHWSGLRFGCFGAVAELNAPSSVCVVYLVLQQCWTLTYLNRRKWTGLVHFLRFKDVKIQHCCKAK